MKIKRISNMDFNSQSHTHKEQINFFNLLDKKILNKNFVNYILNFFNLYKKKKYINLKFENKYDLEVVYVWLFEFISLYNEMLQDDKRTNDTVILETVYDIKMISKSYKSKLNDIGITLLNDDTLSINKISFIKANYDNILEIIQGENCYLELINKKVNEMNQYIDTQYNIK